MIVQVTVNKEKHQNNVNNLNLWFAFFFKFALGL